jgi:diguanylate cyclase (GGDEF)-like protein
VKNIHPSIREVAVLQEATEMILSSVDVDTVLHQILLIVRNYFGVANCAVFLLDPETSELYCRAQNGYSDPSLRDRRIKLGDHGITGWVAQNKTPKYVPNVSKESSYAHDPVVRSELALPLIVRDEVLGVLSIGSEHLDYFNDSMIGLLALFAGQAAVAMENARLYSSERRRMRQIELINLIARSATAANDVEQLVSNLADLIEDTFDASGVCLLLRDHEGQLAMRAYAGKLAPTPVSVAASERSGIIAQAFATRMNAVANQLTTRTDWPVCFAESGSELCVPLVSLGETLGALLIAHASAQAFNAEERSIAQAAADVCATAIRNVQLADELRRVSNTDSLTGLYSQRYLHVLAAQETSRSRRYGKRFSLLMLEAKEQSAAPADLDRGDDLLKQVAQVLKRQLRGVDSVCRYGTDRFVIILPETPSQGLPGVQRKVQESLVSVPIQGTDSNLALRFAFASYPENGATELELLRNLLARMDESREQASAAG